MSEEKDLRQVETPSGLLYVDSENRVQRWESRNPDGTSTVLVAPEPDCAPTLTKPE